VNSEQEEENLSPAPTAQFVHEEPHAKNAEDAEGRRKDFYMWDYSFSSRFILVTIFISLYSLLLFFLFAPFA